MPEPLICAGCALLCDDPIADQARLRPTCSVGERWLAGGLRALDETAAAATVDGVPVALGTAIRRCAELLREARRPLLHGFAQATVEDARAAVKLADRIGAIVAPGPVDAGWAGAPAFALRGASSATLGEIRDRSRVVVIWREDPEGSHPRLLERLGFPVGGDDRVLIVVDDRETATAALADVRLTWPGNRDADALGVLHTLARGLTVALDRGDPLGELGALAQRLQAAPHAAIVYGSGLAAGTGGQRRALALHELVRTLCHGRHVVTLALAGAPGVRAADDVLTWQTGWPGPVDLGRGYPRALTATAPLCEQERVDLALCVEDDPRGIADAVATRIAFVARPVEPLGGDVAVAIRTAPAGIGAAGTTHRLDGVPLTLAPPHTSDRPTAAELLAQIHEHPGR